METLPDDVWHRILETGTKTGRLDHKDLCSLSMTSRGFDKLAQDSALWAALLDRDFHPSDEAPSKALYKEEFEMDRSFWRLLRNWGTFPPRSSYYYEPSYAFFHYDQLHFESLPYYDDLWELSDGIDDLITNNGNGEDEIGLPSTSRATHVPYVKDKFSKRRPKEPKLKVKPNSKSYIPMSRPPRRSMPRKI